jgi:diguanylate cyclase (GGDEF)-like protein
VAGRDSPAAHHTDPQATRIARAWRLLVGSFTVLGAIAVLDVVVGGPAVLHVAVVALVALAAAAALVHRGAMQALEDRRRTEIESFARILQGLSRSVSPDAIVEAIAEELGEAAGADHVAVVRLRPNTGLLEATLVTTRGGAPNSTTVLPLSDLDDPGDRANAPRARVPVGPGRAGEPSSSPASGSGGDVPVAEAMVLDDERVIRLASRRGPEAPGVGAKGGEDPGRRKATDRVAERLAARVRGVFGFRNTLVAPLETPTGVVGAIVLSRRTADPWPDGAERLLTGAAAEASAALSRVYSLRAAEERASTDALTGLPNRRYFEEVSSLFARRRRANDAVGILMIDIDRFKALNDRHGHGVGDLVLRAVATAIVSAVREDDVPARYGGEEFVVLLRDPAPGVAVDVGERVRAAVRALDLSAHGVGEVSVSVGVAVATSPDERVADLVEQADRALYRAKRAGRDRVVAA